MTGRSSFEESKAGRAARRGRAFAEATQSFALLLGGHWESIVAKIGAGYHYLDGEMASEGEEHLHLVGYIEGHHRHH